MVFIPSAIMSNAEKYNMSTIGTYGMDSFELKDFQGFDSLGKRKRIWSEPQTFLEFSRYDASLKHSI